MDAPETLDPTRLSWNDPVWLAHRGIPTPETVFAYFRGSSFYDNTCVNEQFIMRNEDPTPEKIRQMSGVSYEVVHSADHRLFVLAKLHRVHPGEEPRTMALYYVLDGTVFQCPDVLLLATARITSATYRLRVAMEALASSVDVYPPLIYHARGSTTTTNANSTHAEHLHPPLTRALSLAEARAADVVHGDAVACVDQALDLLTRRLKRPIAPQQ